MTSQEVHELLCEQMSATDKMNLALACQLQGVPIQSVENTLAGIITVVQDAIEPALKTYNYLQGGTDYGRKTNVCENNNR